MRKLRLPLISVIIAMLIITAAAVVVVLSIADYSDSQNEARLNEIRATVLSYISQCYALEGRYPPNLDYLHQNYGLQLDTENYTYHYEIFASNIYPNVHVLAKAGDAS